MKKILVTGGAGYIGSHVAHLLIKKKYNVTIIDNLVTGNKKIVPKKAELIICDIENTEKIKKILKDKKFSVVLHFAGLIRVDESIKKPKKYLTYNYFKAKKFFETCFEMGLKKVVFSSTAAVYGSPAVSKVTEKSKLKPMNPYARSKLKLENFLVKKNKIGVKSIILRYFNVAGADKKMRTGLISKKSTHLIKIACEVAVGKKDLLTINGSNYKTKDGTPERDFIHVSDLAEIHEIVTKYLIKGGNSNIFNCGYGNGFSVKQVITTFNAILKKNLKIKIGPRRKGDSKRIISNTNKFKKKFLWKPKYNNLNVILKTALLWEKKLKNFN